MKMQQAYCYRALQELPLFFNCLLNLSDNILEKQFQPLLIIKPWEQGIGLGISLSYDRVKTPGAKATVEYNQMKEIVFPINFPINN